MTVYRNKQIDTAKGILMSLVILGHVLLASNNLPQAGSFLLKLIYSFHMPAFLIISGILFDRERQKGNSFQAFLLARVKHILMPYFIFETLGGIVQNVFTYGNREAALAVLTRIVTFRMYVGADWYLLTYFFAIILVYLANKYIQNNHYLLISAFLLFVVVSVSQNQLLNELSVFILRILLVYSLIVFGIFLKDTLLSYSLKKILIAGVCFTLSVGLNIIIFMHAVMLGNPLLFLLGGISATYLVIQLAAIIKNNLINMFGRYSIVPMGIHQDIIWIFGWFFGLNGASPLIILNAAAIYLLCISATMMYRSIVGKE
ncbi:MAG: acyltransferase family protein [Solobacterium sp.]|nr:acyltransferase family protein [Solobacterium sp.]